MDILSVKFIDSDIKRIDRAIGKLIRVVTSQMFELPYNCSIEYVNIVRKNILTGKYSGSYQRYNDRYADWKTNKMLLGSTFWILQGELLKSLSSFKMGNGVFGGVPAGAMDSGGKSWNGDRSNPKGKIKPIAMYGRTMEYGLNNHPARPLFQPSLDEFIETKFNLLLSMSKAKMISAWY